MSIDVSLVVTAIVAQALPLAAVSVAVLLLAVLLRAFAWLKSAMGVEYDPDGFDQDS